METGFPLTRGNLELVNRPNFFRGIRRASLALMMAFATVRMLIFTAAFFSSVGTTVRRLTTLFRFGVGLASGFPRGFFAAGDFAK